MDADVIVVGLGAMGSQALWRLAARGAEVVGIEQFGVGHDRGGSHGESRIIRTAYAEGAAYVPLAREAWRLWRELEKASGAELLQRTGCLSTASAGAKQVVGPVASAEAYGLAYELLSAGEIRDRFPQFVVPDGYMGVYDPDAGYVRPERAIVAAVDVARGHGAQVLDRTAIARVVPDAVRPSVVLADGQRLAARHIVLSAGSWIRELSPPVGEFLRIERRVMGWFRISGGNAPVYADDTMPVFIGNNPAGNGNWYGFPSLDGHTVKLGLHAWPGIDEPVDPDRGHRPPDSADAARFAAAVPGILAHADPEPVRMQSCMYDLTPDGHFLIGPHRDLPGVTVLGGFSGHGFKFASAIGDIAADYALTRHTDRLVAPFDPHRFD